MKLYFALIVVCLSSANSLTYEILSPRYMKELLMNKTEELGTSIKTQTTKVGNIITNYVDVTKKQTQDTQENVKKYFSKAYNEISNTIGDVKTKTARKLNVFENITKYNPEMYLDTVQLIAMNGYPAESHTIKTEDGYLLTIHRIPHNKNSTVVNRQAVLLQHGLLGSSSNFVTSGSEKGLAYILSEAGYDVWMGNFRGNTYSRSHVSLSVSDPAFWNFSWHECAMYDLPAIIDYINEIKQSDKELLYIGHSMGTTTLFALLSTRLEYNDKLKAAFAMAPVAYMAYVRSPLKYLAPFANNIEWIAKSLGADQFIPQSFIFKWFASIGCEINYYSQEACRNVLFLLSGFNSKEFNTERFPVILSHTPAGTSTKTVVHFAQEIRDKGKFQQFDYGVTENNKMYGQDTPPEYPVEKITLPIAFLCAPNDLLSSFQDSELLYTKLVNPIEYYKVPMEEFNHIDFLWAIDAPTLVYDKLLSMMKEFTIKKEATLSYYFKWRFMI